MNKYVFIEQLVKGNIGAFILSETKLDKTFANKQFEIQGCKRFVKLETSIEVDWCSTQF